METLQYTSIILEALIVLIAVWIALSRRRIYGLGFAVTFGIYVYYDYMKLTGGTISTKLAGLFFIATLSALASMWSVYKKSV